MEGTCVICQSDLSEMFHHPVENHCRCKTRVCQDCCPRLRKCPTCRCPCVGPAVDHDFLNLLVLETKGKQCNGCQQFVRSRHVLKHNRECPSLLALRLQETMDQLRQTEKQYRKAIRDNEHLNMHLHEISYQNYLLRGPSLAPALEEEEESQGADSDMELEVDHESVVGQQRYAGHLAQHRYQHQHQHRQHQHQH